MAIKVGMNGANKQQAWDFDFVGCPVGTLFARLSTSQKGISDDDAQSRAERYGYNEPAKKKRRAIVLQFISKILNPLVIVLLVIAGFSLFFG